MLELMNRTNAAELGARTDHGWNARMEGLAADLARDLEVSVDADPIRARQAADGFVAELMATLIEEHEAENPIRRQEYRRGA